MVRKGLRNYKSIQNGTLTPFRHLDSCPLTGPSIQDALRNFIPPIKTGDPRVDFYTMYKRESAEHETYYVKKYDEDLNTTFNIRTLLVIYFANDPTHSCRLVCSLLSALPSPSMSS